MFINNTLSDRKMLILLATATKILNCDRYDFLTTRNASRVHFSLVFLVQVESVCVCSSPAGGRNSLREFWPVYGAGANPAS